MRYFSVLLLLFTIGCSSFPLQVSRPNRPAYGPDTLLTVISALQDEAIAMEAAKTLPTSSARMIVTFVVNTAKLVKESSTNVAWRQLTGANLTQLRRDLPVVDEGKFSAKFDLIQKIVDQR